MGNYKAVECHLQTSKTEEFSVQHPHGKAMEMYLWTCKILDIYPTQGNLKKAPESMKTLIRTEISREGDK